MITPLDFMFSLQFISGNSSMQEPQFAMDSAPTKPGDIRPFKAFSDSARNVAFGVYPKFHARIHPA